MIKREYPDSKRRKKCEICKNCEFIVVKIRLPNANDFNDRPKEPKMIMRETAKALVVNHESNFYCTYMPEWRELNKELTHFCSHLIMRANWQLGYQDIERVWEEVDRVYETRWDCRMSPAA